MKSSNIIVILASYCFTDSKYSSAARNWSVVTGDRQLARRVRDAGATVRSLQEWRTRLIAADSSAHASEKPSEPRSPDDVADWEEYFAQGREAEED